MSRLACTANTTWNVIITNQMVSLFEISYCGTNFQNLANELMTKNDVVICRNSWRISKDMHICSANAAGKHLNQHFFILFYLRFRSILIRPLSAALKNDRLHFILASIFIPFRLSLLFCFQQMLSASYLTYAVFLLHHKPNFPVAY